MDLEVPTERRPETRFRRRRSGLLLIVALLAAFTAPVSAQPETPQTTETAAVLVSDRALLASLDRISRGSPTWRKAIDAVRRTGRSVFVAPLHDVQGGARSRRVCHDGPGGGRPDPGSRPSDPACRRRRQLAIAPADSRGKPARAAPLRRGSRPHHRARGVRPRDSLSARGQPFRSMRRSEARRAGLGRMFDSARERCPSRAWSRPPTRRWVVELDARVGTSLLKSPQTLRRPSKSSGVASPFLRYTRNLLTRL